MSLLQSSGCRKPWRILPTSTRASEQTIRFASCSRGISSEKTATPTPGSSLDAVPALVGAARRARRCVGDATFAARLRTKRRLAHAGARRDDGEVAVVQAGGLGVEPLEARRDAGDAIAALGGVGDLLERLFG